jgi:hypothetical protein
VEQALALEFADLELAGEAEHGGGLAAGQVTLAASRSTQVFAGRGLQV